MHIFSPGADISGKIRLVARNGVLRYLLTTAAVLLFALVSNVRGQGNLISDSLSTPVLFDSSVYVGDPAPPYENRTPVANPPGGLIATAAWYTYGMKLDWNVVDNGDGTYMYYYHFWPGWLATTNGSGGGGDGSGNPYVTNKNVTAWDIQIGSAMGMADIINPTWNVYRYDGKKVGSGTATTWTKYNTNGTVSSTGTDTLLAVGELVGETGYTDPATGDEFYLQNQLFHGLRWLNPASNGSFIFSNDVNFDLTFTTTYAPGWGNFFTNSTRTGSNNNYSNVVAYNSSDAGYDPAKLAIPVSFNNTVATPGTPENTRPTATIGEPSVSITKGGPITYTILYHDDNFYSVTLSPADIILDTTGSVNGTVSVSDTGSNGSTVTGTTSRTVTIDNITGDGTLGISLPAGRATDKGGNTALAAGPSSIFTVDNTPPTVSISFPSTTYTKNGPVTYMISYDDANFDKSTLSIDDIILNKTDSANGTLSLDGSGSSRTVTISDITGLGTLGISLKAGTAIDRAGNQAPAKGPSDTFSIDTTSPTAAITYSSVGPYKPGTVVTINAAFSEPMAASPAPKIALSGAATLAAADMTRTDATHYTYSYTVGSGSGNVNVTLSTGTDLAGNTVISTPTGGGTFTIDSTAPTAAITYSPAGPYKAGTIVTITAAFSESIADSPAPKISLSGTAALAASDMTKTDATHYTYSYTTGSGNGTATVALSTGTDLAGNTVTSSPTNGSTFAIDNTAPTAAITYSPAGPYKVGTVITITAAFSEAIADSPAPKISLSGTAALAASDMTKTDATHYTYSYTAGSGDGTATVALSTGTDLAGNTITPTPTAGATFIMDNTPPEVTSTTPVNGAVDIGTGSAITATFSEAIDPATINDSTFTVSGVSGTLYYEPTTRTASFTPSAALAYSTSYSATITGVRDIPGNAMTTDKTWNFTTTAAPDTTAPTAAITYSQAGPYKTGAAVTITATFSEAMAVSPAPKISLSGAASLEAEMTRLDATHYTYSYSAGSGNGAVTVSLSAGTDLAGNLVTAAPTSGATFTIDNTAPTISSTLPVDGATGVGIDNQVSVTFSEPMNPGAVTGGAFTINGVTGSVTYNASTRTAVLTPSSHLAYGTTYTATVNTGATDLAGNSLPANKTWTFTTATAPDTTAPTAAITYSSAGPYKAGTAVIITAAFSEAMADSPVPRISLSGAANLSPADMTKLDTTHYTYSYTVSSGNGEVTAALSAGTDLAGNTVVSAPTSGAVFAIDTTVPSISSVSPTEGAAGAAIDSAITATFSEPMDALTVNDTAFTVNGVTGTVSYDAGNRVAVFTPDSSLGYSTTYTATISTGVKDLAGNPLAADKTWTFTTTAAPDYTAPTAVITYSPAGPYKAGTTVTITTVFSESMADSPVPKISLSGAANLSSADMTKLDETHYRYSYTVGSGNGNVNVAVSGTDLAGNTVSAVPISGATFTIDNAAPTVTSTSPSNNSGGAGITSTITATFSEAVDTSTVNTGTFTIAGVTGTVSYDEANRIAIFTPGSSLAYGKTYTAAITGVKDITGNAMTADKTWTFTTTTAPDTTPPEIIATSPLDGATGVDIKSPLSVRFSESVNLTGSSFTVNGVTGSLEYNDSTHTAYFIPSGGLNYFTTYTATVTGVKDLAGNDMAANKTWTFTTVPLYGDLKGTGGEVAVEDAVLALRIASGFVRPTPQQLAAGDVAPLANGKPNPDGKLDISDVVAILMKIVGLVNW